MRSALMLSLVTLVAGCGDKFGTNEFARMNVEVESVSVVNGGSAFFGQAIQQTVAKTVNITNSGQATLNITGVDWEVGEGGQKLKNQYVEIDWRGAVDADSFPWKIDPTNRNPLTFAIEFTPPLGKPLDDFSDSVLLIKTSNARSDTGNELVTEFRVHFTMKQDVAIPRVTPSSYNFQNATIAKPETQEFRIYNDSDLATAPFHVLSVAFESPTTEFTLSQTPSSGATVLEPGNPAYQDIVFKVTYQPTDNTPDTNAILISTDVGAGGNLRVPLTTGTTHGDFSLSYSHVDEFDFSHVTQRETRSVLITCDGPGPMTIKLPRIEPAEARQDYSFTAWATATRPEDQDTEVTSWPRGLNVGRTLRIDVEYAPKTDGSDSANGLLIIPYENPDLGEIQIDLLSGEPKSKIVLAPKTELIAVTGAVTSGETGSRTVVVYNEGNGPLQVKGARVHADFDLPAKVWTLSDSFAPFTLEPDDLQLIEVDYDLGQVTDADGLQTEYIEIAYFDDFLQSDQNKVVGLSAGDSQGKANPVASLGSPGDYAGATAGQALTLNASGSSAANGAIESNAYIYYLTAKPAGSRAKLNVQTGASTSFMPDVGGSYSFELVVYAKDGNLYLYSAPATLTITVAN